MSTEYRRGIPSVAHVEAATRLGLEWEDNDTDWSHARWRFEMRGDRLYSDCALRNANYLNWAQELVDDTSGNMRNAFYRPIRTDGTAVDWEVLDAEARVHAGRAGELAQPATVTPTVSAAPPTQPQGFRADLWRRICAEFNHHDEAFSLKDINAIDVGGSLIINGYARTWPQPFGPAYDGILARWTVYQELKPLYDLVDGAQGEVAMPRDVELAWAYCVAPSAPFAEGWFLFRDESGLRARLSWGLSWRPEEDEYGTPLRNFAAVLDAVAERRVAERMRGQTQASTVTAAQLDEPVLDEAALRSLILNLPNVASITSRIERGSRQRDRYIVRVQLADPNVPLDRALAAQIPRNVHVHCEGRGDGGQRGVGGTASSIFSPTGNREDAVVPPIQEPRRVNVEPRRFADVRPDRHGWRWWRDLTNGYCFTIRDGVYVQRVDAASDPWSALDLSAWLDRTVIPTDEQGNPVSWETIGQGRFTPEEAQRVEAAVADAIQNRLTQAPQPRILNLDDLTTLLRRHLGDDVSIVSLRRPRGVYRVQIDFADDTRTAGITAQNLPHNVSIWRSTRGRTCDFDLRGTDASTTLVCNLATHPASAATSQPTYFAVDGDTMTTPSGAPPWLHQMCAEMRATATWCRTKANFALVFELAYGQTLEKSMTVRAVRNISLPGFPTVTVTATNRPAPPVPVCLVAAMRRNQDLAALQPDDAIPGERDATVAWAQMDPTTSQLCRNVVREIVEHGCYGLDDAAAAKRAGHYATLIAEAAAAKVETSSHVRAWCAQFQTRVALLEVDEGEVVNSAATSATLRLGTKPPTPAAIAKFRELMSSKMCPGRTEATKQSGLDCEATQHVLLRWCSGLDDAAATEVVGAVWRSFGAAYSTHQPLTRIDAIAQAALPRPALDVSGATTLDPALERARQAREARRRSLAELQAQLQRERALRACADVAAAVEQPSRFALLEVDEAADPAASIARWQAGRAAAAGRRSVDVSPTAAKWQPPTAALHRIDFDVPVRHDYVDVSDMPIEVQGAVIIETLVDVARRAGGMWEN